MISLTFGHSDIVQVPVKRWLGPVALMLCSCTAAASTARPPMTAFIADDYRSDLGAAKDVGGRLKRLKHITVKERVWPLARCFVLDA